MTTRRRIGAESSATRAALLDAAQQLILEEGFAAASSRRIAAKAGLKPQLVHYYFRTMDDLYLALVRRGAEQNLERQARALSSPHPLRALWEFSSDPTGARMTMEFVALANHRPAIRAELGAYAEQFRRLQSEALAEVLERSGVDTEAFPIDALLVLMTSLSRLMVVEELLGLTTGHAAMRSIVEQFLTRFEGPVSSADSRSVSGVEITRTRSTTTGGSSSSNDALPAGRPGA